MNACHQYSRLIHSIDFPVDDPGSFLSHTIRSILFASNPGSRSLAHILCILYARPEYTCVGLGVECKEQKALACMTHKVAKVGHAAKERPESASFTAATYRSGAQLTRDRSKVVRSGATRRLATLSC